MNEFCGDGRLDGRLSFCNCDWDAPFGWSHWLLSNWVCGQMHARTDLVTHSLRSMGVVIDAMLRSRSVAAEASAKHHFNCKRR